MCSRALESIDKMSSNTNIVSYHAKATAVDDCGHIAWRSKLDIVGVVVIRMSDDDASGE